MWNRRTWLGLIGGMATARAFALSTNALELEAHFEGDYLRIAIPRFTFLDGTELARLKDGASVAYLAQLTLSTTPNSLMPVARSVARFALSYDIWEERFQATRIGSVPGTNRSTAHLSEQAVQDWCIDNLTIDRSQIPSDRSFYLQFDFRAEDPRDQSGIVGEPGINLTKLIEIFSRPTRGAQPRWLITAGPFRLEDLRRVRG
jgi:hypothetical protein